MEPLEPLGDWIDKAPFKSRKVLFIGVYDTYTMQAWKVTEKRELLLHDLGREHAILVVWAGEYSSTSRYVDLSTDDVAKVLDHLA